MSVRPESRDEILPGSVWWAQARGYWRQVRVDGPVGRRTVRVRYWVQATRSATPTLRVQDLPLGSFRRDDPGGVYGVVRTSAPPPAPGTVAPSTQVRTCGCGREYMPVPGVAEARCFFCTRSGLA